MSTIEKNEVKSMENRKRRLPNRVFFYFTVLIIYIFFYKLYVTILNLPYDFKTSKREKYSFPPGSVNIPNILSHIFQPLQDSYIFRTILIAERFTNDSTWALPIKFNTTTTSIEERNITLESWSFPAKVFFRDKFLISEPMFFSTLIEPNNYLTEFNFSFMTNTKYFTHITVYHQFNQTNFDPVIKFKENVKHIMSSGKFEKLKVMLEEIISEGHRVLLFSQFVNMLDIVKDWLEREGIDYGHMFNPKAEHLYYGMTAKHGWEWFDSVREEERFKEYIERAKLLMESEKVTS